MTPPIPTTIDAAQPPMLLIIPESRLEDLPSVVYAGVQGCTAAYHAGKYYIEVPHALYAAWPVIRLEGAASGNP